MPVVAQVVQVIVSMRSAASVTLLAFALTQCYATRTRDDCTPMSVHATMAECEELAIEYRKFDTRALRDTGFAGGGQLSVRGGQVIVDAAG